MKYQKVKVLYKDKDKVFGVYAMTDDNTVVSAVMDQVKMDSADKIKIDGTKYTVDTNILDRLCKRQGYQHQDRCLG